VVFNNDFALSLPTTINFSVPHLSAKEIMDLFDAANIRVSSGSACSSKVTGSFVLDAMGLEQWQSEGAIRMSFGPASTAKEIDHACQRIKQAVAALTSSCIISSTDDMEKGELDGLIQLHHNGACCWIIADKASKQCIVIDPLEHLAERIEKMVLCRHYSVVAIIDTHSHADHDSCREMLTTVLAHSMVQGLVDEQGWPVAHNLVTLEQGQAAQAITIGNNMLVKLATPGHTNDSISLLLGPSASSLRRNEVAHAFVGDLILIGGLGRTDFGISSAASFYHSINALSSAITPDTILCTSHDYNAEFTTTLAIESAEHGLLAKVLNGELNEAEFMAEKLQLDDNILEQQRQAKVLMCGALSTGTVDTQGINLAPALAKTYVNAHPEAIILDVREAHEFKLQNIERVGNVQNIPPSRFTGFMAQLMKNHSKDQELICICRSGSRSEVVAKNLRRLGFENTRHVQGGMALYSVD
jgi:cysteine desulfurase